jgi:hypothetical protein
MHSSDHHLQVSSAAELYKSDGIHTVLLAKASEARCAKVSPNTRSSRIESLHIVDSAHQGLGTIKSSRPTITRIGNDTSWRDEEVEQYLT